MDGTLTKNVTLKCRAPPLCFAASYIGHTTILDQEPSYKKDLCLRCCTFANKRTAWTFRTTRHYSMILIFLSSINVSLFESLSLHCYLLPKLTSSPPLFLTLLSFASFFSTSSHVSVFLAITLLHLLHLVFLSDLCLYYACTYFYCDLYFLFHLSIFSFIKYF